MTASDRRDAVRELPGGVLTAIMLVGLYLGFIPLSRMLEPVSWLVISAWCVFAVFLMGYAMRRIWGATALVPVVQAAFVLVTLTATFSPAGAILGLVPTPGSLNDLWTSLREGVDLFRTSSAPLEPSTAAGALMTSILAALAVVLDLLVMRLRFVVVGVVAVITLALFPSIFVPTDGDVVTAVAALAVSVTLLLAARPSRPQDRPRRAAAAVAVAVPALLVALIVTPLVPLRAATGNGFGIATTIDATIDLGRDLRNPRESAVLKIHSNAKAAPYLRLATLSNFDGGVWTPDENVSPQALQWLADQRPLGASGDATTDRRARVSMDSVSMSMLPLPAGATGVDGVSEDWSVMTENRTVASSGQSAAGLDYDVTFVELDPSTQQLQAATFNAVALNDPTRVLPDVVPVLIQDEMARVTGEAATAYDKLMALQTWFRSSEFTYSLDTPVEDGYDRGGLSAMEAFLTEKSGYCVHFASTFTVMAREMGLPARVALGFLPGSATNEKVDGETVYAVDSSQLHTWPEVFFDGIGWVPFEPTASLGVASTFRTEADSPAATAAPEESAAPLPTAATPTLAPRDRTDADAGSAASGRAVDLRVPGIVLLVLAVLATPAAFRIWLRRRRLARADAGDAVGAWEEVLASAVDLGVPFDPADSPRAIGAVLAAHDANVTSIVRAVERQSYARPNPDARVRTLVPAVQTARAAWIARARPFRRIGATVLPLSLLRRPVIATRPEAASEAEWSRAPARTR